MKEFRSLTAHWRVVDLISGSEGEDFAYGLVVVSSATLHDGHIKNEWRQCQLFSWREIPEYGLPMSLIFAYIVKQPLETCSIVFISCESVGRCSACTQRSGADESHHIGGMVGGAERVSSSFLALQWARRLGLTFPQGRIPT